MNYSILGYNHPYGYYAGTSAYKFLSPPSETRPSACSATVPIPPPNPESGGVCASSGGGGSCSAPAPSSSSVAPGQPKWTRDPKLWGPHLWAYLHYSASNYPDNPTEEQIKEMMNWLTCLPVTIPCSECSKHYKNYIQQNRTNLPAICSTKNNLFRFLVDIHNKVNERYGKPKLSYEDAWKLYN
jgi:hypothetical protein